MKGAVLVTGASTGIGYHIADTLACREFTVFGTVRREQDGHRLEAAGITPVIMDVTDRSSITRASGTVRAALGDTPLVALVNNAGIARAGPVECVRLDDVRAVLEVNVLGVIAVIQTFLPLLRASRGRIVNISSVSGRMALPFMGPYAASKFALEAISDSLRRELIPQGIRVVVIQPGSIRTPIWDKASTLDLTSTRGTAYEAVASLVRETAVARGRTGLPAARVADAVFRAITTSRPPTRILVVRSRFKTWLSGHLPDRALDRGVARRLWGTTG